MDKNTEYLIGGFLLICFCFAMFNMDITGFIGKEMGAITIELTDENGVPQTVFERGERFNAIVTVGKGAGVYNEWMWISNDNYDKTRVQATAKRICGRGEANCKEGTYMVEYRIEDTPSKFADGNYYIRIKQHKGDYIYKQFKIEGPKLDKYGNSVYYN